MKIEIPIYAGAPIGTKDQWSRTERVGNFRVYTGMWEPRADGRIWAPNLALTFGVGHKNYRCHDIGLNGRPWIYTFFVFMAHCALSVQVCINNKRQLIKSIRMDFVHQSIHMVLELELSRITWIFRKIDLLLELWSYFTHGRSIHKFKANLNHSNSSNLIRC